MWFRDMGPGTYSLRAEQDADSWPVKILEVEAEGPRGTTVPMTWPKTAPLLVGSLKGILHAPNYVPGQPGPKLTVALLSGTSGKRLTSLQTSETGEFDFGIRVPGIYFLSLEPSAVRGWDGSPITGQIAVSMETDAPSDHLDLELGWTSCGLSYVDQSPCPPAELHISRLRGRVVGPGDAIIVKGEELLRHPSVPIDPAGPVIANAEILLVDSSGKLIERLRTDRSGEFASTQ